jgi:hypothetical protein
MNSYPSKQCAAQKGTSLAHHRAARAYQGGSRKQNAETNLVVHSLRLRLTAYNHKRASNARRNKTSERSSSSCTCILRGQANKEEANLAVHSLRLRLHAAHRRLHAIQLAILLRQAVVLRLQKRLQPHCYRHGRGIRKPC